MKRLNLSKITVLICMFFVAFATEQAMAQNIPNWFKWKVTKFSFVASGKTDDLSSPNYYYLRISMQFTNHGKNDVTAIYNKKVTFNAKVTAYQSKLKKNDTLPLFLEAGKSVSSTLDFPNVSNLEIWPGNSDFWSFDIYLKNIIKPNTYCSWAEINEAIAKNKATPDSFFENKTVSFNCYVRAK